jgi:hypothetical protein
VAFAPAIHPALRSVGVRVALAASALSRTSGVAALGVLCDA